MKKNTKTMRLPKSTAQETTTTESPRQTVGIDLGDQTSLGAFSTLKANVLCVRRADGCVWYFRNLIFIDPSGLLIGGVEREPVRRSASVLY